MFYECWQLRVRKIHIKVTQHYVIVINAWIEINNIM